MEKNSAGYQSVGSLTLPSNLMKIYNVDTTNVKREVVHESFNDSDYSEYNDIENNTNTIKKDDNKIQNTKKETLDNKSIQTDEDKKNEENKLLNKKTKHPKFGVLTLPADVMKKHYSKYNIFSIYSKKEDKAKFCKNKKSKTSKRTNNKKNNKQK